MRIGPGDVPLSAEELRAVVRFAVEFAEEVLPIFDERHDDARPRAAVSAARTFADGADRTKAQRITALDAHRAAKEATSEAASHAARAAGDAAAAAYLHPLAQATQVSHILRAAAHAARAAELVAGDVPSVGEQHIELARLRATPVLVDVLSRYPRAPAGKSRVAQLISAPIGGNPRLQPGEEPIPSVLR
ncbi:putative immunity protein [Saccharopolyspora dendranthemae]|uniref:Imm-5-like domain-containing protein n=1 Tax=Saccharopolyspora dendranthemae TaxID=1181886 RepID=A0A561U4K0_9PSEU|nr:exonuclease SbcC [Saccharopolyspora dendranthemae]TWF94283.1 hypothetical protein FHU35_14570 [Saccharopolyspora dendranthemae]